MVKFLKKIVVIAALFPVMVFASDTNPFDVMHIQEDISDSGGDIVVWFKDVLSNEYFPLILGAVGLLILATCGSHIYFGLKKARSEEGSTGAITEHFTISLIGAVIGLALIGMAWSINSGW